jgi:hypothetical protein
MVCGGWQPQYLQALDDPVAVDTLGKTEAMANTYVFFTSDNGWHRGEHRIPGEKSPLADLVSRVRALKTCVAEACQAAEDGKWEQFAEVLGQPRGDGGLPDSVISRPKCGFRRATVRSRLCGNSLRHRS